MSYFNNVDVFENKKQRYISFLIEARKYVPFTMKRADLMDMRDRIDTIHSKIIHSPDNGEAIIRFMESRRLNSRDKIVNACWDQESFSPVIREITSIIISPSNSNSNSSSVLGTHITQLSKRQTSLETMGKGFLEELTKISTGQQNLANATKKGFEIQGEQISNINQRLGVLEGRKAVIHPRNRQLKYTKTNKCWHGKNCKYRPNCNFEH